MNLFKNLEISPLKSQYICSLLLFLVSNRDLFMRNYEYHNIHTRQSNNLNATGQFVYQQGVHYSGIKLVNMLPREIESIAGNWNKFKQA